MADTLYYSDKQVAGLASEGVVDFRVVAAV